MVTLGFIGEVSVGKTTIMNGLIGNYLGHTRLKRTTYLPFKFNHSKKITGSSQIRISGFKAIARAIPTL